MSQDEINQNEWSNPKNWSLFAYRSRLDSRFFVPKRRGMGQTMNFGHKSATLHWNHGLDFVTAGNRFDRHCH
jgi:uncharacterized membrane protein